MVIERIAGPFLMRVTYPDLNYQLRFELNDQGQAMNPEQLSQIAQRAYEIFAASSGEQAPWSAVAAKSKWHDAVRDHHQNPSAIARSEQPSLQERAINQAYRELYQPIAQPALVVPPAASGQTSAKRGKQE